ncbi:MAG: hypothetical protein FWG68_09845 [Defluviitaleaceae bacterium]|nr:hypothetical protein [Defluviitaleaceae bacterium]
MDNRILDILFEIKARYGDMIFYNQQKTKNLMHDLAPSLKAERKHVAQFLELNGYFQLKYAAHAYPSVYARLVQNYMSAYSESMAVANWVVDLFSELLGLSDFKRLNSLIVEPPIVPPPIPETKDIAQLISGYENPYRLERPEKPEKPEKSDKSEKPEKPKNYENSENDKIGEIAKIGKSVKITKSPIKPQSVPISPHGSNKAKNGLVLPLSSRISADMHSIAIMANGDAIAVGPNQDGQCNVIGWNDMAAVCAGPFFSVGLRKDGRVLASGRNEYGQCNVKYWRNIVNISVGARHTVGLKSDGTLVATGQNRNGECDVQHWTNVIHIVAGYLCTFAIRRDYTVLFAGKTKNANAYVGHLADVLDIANPSPGRALVLLKNGRLDVLGDDTTLLANIVKWHDVKEISAGPDYFAGRFNNGTVRILAYYWRVSGIEANPDTWQDMETIAAGRFHLLGVRSDGTVAATMLHPNKAMNRGQCRVANWRLK